MMRYRTAFALLFACSLLVGVQSASAQTSVGANVGYNLDNEEFFAGGQLRFAPAGFPILLNPVVETYFLDGTFLQIDVNALYPIGRAYTTTFTPYVGAGVGINYIDTEFGDSSTDAGLNLLGGATFGMGGLRPFAEARINVNDGANVAVRGGVLFTL